jgi:Holliday junction resolvase
LAKADSRRGIERERSLVKQLRADNWFAMRAPASLGVADVVAIRPGEVRLIECKSTAAGAYAGFGPADRRRLSAAAKVAGGSAWLYWHPKNKPAVWIPEAEWPR